MSKAMRVLAVAFGAVATLPGLMMAQTREVTGTVTAAFSGQPVPQATVSVVGTTTTVRTDASGRFVVEVPVGEARLTVRAFGFIRTDAVVPGGLSNIDFQLDNDVFKLDEVVVTGQATVVERRNVTTSVGYVSGEDVSKVAAPTIESAFYGRLAGVNIQSNGGAPGGGMQLQIRGSNTILGGFDPLFVVDGVIYSNARILGGRSSIVRGFSVLEDDPANRLADLNPADIQSIEVLKGAAAAAIFGSKAAGGVVVIKTIRGRIGTPHVSVSQRVGVFDLHRGYKPRCWGSVAEAVDVYGQLAASYLAEHPLQCYDHYAQVWGRNRVSYETVADFSGGDAQTRYFASATWKRDNGIEPGTGFGRQGFRVNLDRDIGSQFTVSVSSVFNRAIHQRGWGNNCNNFACYGYALAYTPSFVDLRRQPDGSYVNPAAAAGSAPNSNPLQTAAGARNTAETNRFTGGATITWDARTTDRTSFKLIGTMGGDLFIQNDDLLAPSDLFFQQQEARPGAAIENSAASRLVNWNLNGVHTLRMRGILFTTSAGIQYESARLKTTRILAAGLLPGQENVSQATNLAAGELLTRDRTLAFYAGEELLLFGERFLLSGGARVERSSANGDTEEYFFYPRLSGKFSIPHVLGLGNDLKLRAAYGHLGNLPRFGDKFTLLATPQLGGQIGLAADSVIGNRTVEPERVREIEGGFDYTFWNGRANLDVTLYTRRTTSLLLSRTPAPSSGVTSQIVNGGQISNRGVEVVLGLTPIETRDLTWVSSTTFTLHRSRVDSLPVARFSPTGSGLPGLGVLLIEQGKSLTRLYGPRYQIPGDTTSGVVLGDAGDTEPTFRVGFSNSLAYKSVNLSLTLDWQQGGTVVNLTQYLRDDGRTSADFGTPAHRARVRDGFVNGALADAYFEPASFVKLREISLNWLLPQRWTEAMNLGVRDIRVGLTGRDLFWWTAYSGLDPEVANFGANPIRSNIDVTPYPPSRSIFFNLAVGF